MFNLKIARKLGVEGRFDRFFRPLLVIFDRLKIKLRNNPKIIVVGFNKTGTTSLFYALKELGYVMSNQHDFERLYKKYAEGKIEINELIEKCSRYEVFQDIPFSLPGFYKFMDKKYPNSKFILTIRTSSDIWFRSFKNYYGDTEKLKTNNYLEKGFLYNVFKESYNSENLSKEKCVIAYDTHIKDVETYFESNSNRLLILDISNKNSYLKLCKFLNKKPLRQSFEWKNKTNE